MANTVKLYVPTGEKGARATAFAPRSRVDLEGRTVGLLANNWKSWAQMLDRFDVLLKEKYGVAKTVRRSVPSIGPVGRVQVYEELQKECDVVITGLGH